MKICPLLIDGAVFIFVFWNISKSITSFGLWTFGQNRSKPLITCKRKQENNYTFAIYLSSYNVRAIAFKCNFVMSKIISPSQVNYFQNRQTCRQTDEELCIGANHEICKCGLKNVVWEMNDLFNSDALQRQIHELMQLNPSHRYTNGLERAWITCSVKLGSFSRNCTTQYASCGWYTLRDFTLCRGRRTCIKKYLCSSFRGKANPLMILKI